MIRNILLALTLIVWSTAAYSQKAGTQTRIDSQYVHVGNEAVTVYVNKTTGQFWVSRGDAEYMLFAGGDGGTSATSVYFDGTVFTNNDLRAPQPPAGTVYMPLGSTRVVDDTVYFATDILLKDKTLRVTQQFVPVLEKDYGFIRITTSLENASGQTVQAGMQVLYDLYMKSTDAVNVLVDSIAILNERQWVQPDIPAYWLGNASVVPWLLKGRMDGNGTTAPDVFTVGNWEYNGYLGAPYWTYVPSGLSLGHDNAILLQWNQAALAQGATRTIVTDYGTDILLDFSLTCMADTLALNENGDGYIPDPFQVTSYVSNTGDVTLQNLQMELLLPAGITLVVGESAVKNVPAPLGTGETVPVIWNLHADTSKYARTVTLTIICSNGTIQDTCQVDVEIPGIPYYELQLHCPQDMTVQLSPDGTKYLSDTVSVTVEVENTGTGDINAMSAYVEGYSPLQLIAGAQVQFLAPDIVLPGNVSQASWRFIVPIAFKDTSYTMTIHIRRVPYLIDSCHVTVYVPGLSIARCVENGILTNGTSFHGSLLYNDAYDNTAWPKAVLYVMTDSVADVTIVENMTGYTHQFRTDSAAVKTVVLADSGNSLVFLPNFENVERRSVAIQSSYPITVIAGSMRTMHSDATLWLPDHALGTNYVSVGYNETASDETEELVITGTANTTDLTITMPSRSMGGIPGIIPYDFVLNEHESFNIRNNTSGPLGGLTGSILTTSQPVALTSGMASGYVPGYGLGVQYLNPVLHQIPPVSALGTEYVIVPYRSRYGGVTVRVVAAYPSTDVVIQGATHHLADVGDRYETQIDEAVVITSTEPVLVAQYANSSTYDYSGNNYGDASMVVLPPTDRYASCHTFPAGLGSDIGGEQDRFADAYVNLIALDGGEGMVVWNNALVPDTAFHHIAGTQYWHATIPLPAGLQNIGTADMRGVGVIAYAFEYHDAYSFIPAYRVESKGTSTNAIAPVPERLSMHVYPNPAHTVTEAVVLTPHGTYGNIRLYNTLGKEVQTVFDGLFEPGKNAISVSLRDVPAGVYFLVLHSENGSQTQKLHILP